MVGAPAAMRSKTLLRFAILPILAVTACGSGSLASKELRPTTLSPERLHLVEGGALPAGSPVDIKGWIEGLTDQSGANCCSDADGTKPEEVDWDMGEKHYRVKVAGQWIDVPDVAVIKGPNYLGHAVVWLYEEPLQGDVGDESFVDFPYILCFLPGPAI